MAGLLLAQTMWLQVLCKFEDFPILAIEIHNRPVSLFYLTMADSWDIVTGTRQHSLVINAPIISLAFPMDDLHLNTNSGVVVMQSTQNCCIPGAVRDIQALKHRALLNPGAFV